MYQIRALAFFNDKMLRIFSAECQFKIQNKKSTSVKSWFFMCEALRTVGSKMSFFRLGMHHVFHLRREKMV